MKKFLFAISIIFAMSFNSNAQFCDAFVDSIITAGTYTGDYVLDANKVYKITGKVYIGNAVPGNGASLTVPAGTLIFGDKVSKSSLVITRGAQGFFLGTAEKPIVMTSCFAPGQRGAGDWGGLVILGPATTNRGTSVIEGGFDPVLGQHGGGADNTFSSGIYQYVRVEFSGIPFTTDDEINGITMGSVGSGTVMNNLQVSYNGDDGFEWFGGENNAKYLISYKQLDDDFDTDHGFKGKVQFGVAYRDRGLADISKSEAFESDNGSSGFFLNPRTSPIFSNMTLIGPRRTSTDTNFDPDFYYGVHQRRGTKQNIYNSAFSGWDEGMIALDGSQVQNQLIVMGAAVDSFKMSHLTFAGTPTGGPVGGTMNLTQWNTWFNTATYNNQILAQPLDLNLVDQFNEVNPNLTPNAGSPLLNSATNPNAIDPYFTNVTYRGAFGPGAQGRWDAGWSNYNPQATAYGLEYTFANTITLTNNVGQRSAVFGRATGATDGIDPLLGEIDAPPPPPLDEIDIRWDLIGTTDESILDLRSDNNSSSPNPLVYTLKLQLGSSATGNQVLSWNPDALTGGNFTLKDNLGGIVFPDVNMRNQSSVTFTNLALSQVSIEVDWDFTTAVSVAQGWNLVSAMGIHPSGQSINNWWSGRVAGSQVFKYNTACNGTPGYQTISDMTVGQGVWMKNATAQTYNTGGEWPASLWHAVNKPTNVCAGWNLVSGLEYIALTSEITTVPNNIITGAIFGYNGGYQVAGTLDPGKAYWAKFSSNGQLIVPGPYTGAPKAVDVVKEDWAKIILTDNAGNTYTLYSANSEVNLDYYELPPLPPAGAFDVRFGSQRFVDDLTSGQNSIEFTGVEYPVKIRVEGINLKLQDVSGEIINTELRSGDEVFVYNNAISKFIITSGKFTPDSYALEQNYPNPFNPTTTIKFSLPESSNVTLSIYNALGERVAELVNTQLQAGNYSYQWDASNLASGLYLYELRTENFVSTKKMILMK